MLKITRGLIVGALLSVASTGVYANEEGGFSLGAKVGVIDVDLSGVSSDTAFGFNLGYNFTATQSVELEYTMGSASVDVGFLNVDVDVDALGLYWAYRSTGNIYFLGKAGIVNEKVKGSGGGFSASESDTGLSVGIGGGWRISDSFALEAEYTMLESDANFYGVTARFSF